MKQYINFEQARPDLGKLVDVRFAYGVYQFAILERITESLYMWWLVTGERTVALSSDAWCY